MFFYVCMDGWIDRSVVRLIDECIDGWMDVFMYGWMDSCMDVFFFFVSRWLIHYERMLSTVNHFFSRGPNFRKFISTRIKGCSEILETKRDSTEICVHPGIVISGIMSTYAVTIGRSTLFQTTISTVTKQRSKFKSFTFSTKHCMSLSFAYAMG